MDYLPTLGEKWPHSRGNVGKYSLHGSYGFRTSSADARYHSSGEALSCELQIQRPAWTPPLKLNIYTWNPNEPCFDWKRPCFGGLTFKNRGHLGSRYVYIYIYIHRKSKWIKRLAPLVVG